MDKVTHFEFGISNPDQAKKFYEGIFGWKIEAVPDMSYWTIRTTECDENNMPKEPGAINGGFFQKNESSGGPIFVISVASIDETLKNIQAAGGKVAMEKNQVGDFGFYARFSDPDGNVIGLWEDIKKG